MILISAEAFYMFKTSEQLLKIAVEKYKKTNNSEVELKYGEYSGIVGIDGNIEDVLDDLIRNGMAGARSRETLNIVMGFKLFLTLDGIEYFDNPKPSENSGKPVVQQNTYNNCNIQEIIGNNNTVIQNNRQNDINQLRDLISDFLNTQSVNNDDLKDELQSIVEDIDEGKIDKKQASRWWNRLSKISDVVTIGTTACNLLPMVQENLPAILDFIQHIIHRGLH